MYCDAQRGSNPAMDVMCEDLFQRLWRGRRNCWGGMASRRALCATLVRLLAAVQRFGRVCHRGCASSFQQPEQTRTKRTAGNRRRAAGGRPYIPRPAGRISPGRPALYPPAGRPYIPRPAGRISPGRPAVYPRPAGRISPGRPAVYPPAGRPYISRPAGRPYIPRPAFVMV